MNSTRVDPVFAEAFRAALVTKVNAGRLPRRRRWMIGGGIFALVVVTGGAGMATADLIRLPGAETTAELGSPTSGTFTGTATLQLGNPPREASGIQIALSCLTEGTFTYPDGARMTCGPTEIGTRADSGSYTIPLASGQTSVTISTSAAAVWKITATYVSSQSSDWAINANGQSYGIMNASGDPDLIAVVATNGKEGYVKRTELEDADGTTAMKSFTSPEDALRWQNAEGRRDHEIPVYKSDGTTRIGTFLIAGSPGTGK